MVLPGTTMTQEEVKICFENEQLQQCCESMAKCQAELKSWSGAEWECEWDF